MSCSGCARRRAKLMAMAKRKTGAVRRVINKPSGNAPDPNISEHKTTDKKA
jgi:hypothetical protein